MAEPTVTGDRLRERKRRNQRAWRLRRRRGLHVAIIRVTEAQVEWLKKKGYLPEMLWQPRDLGEAIETFLMDFAV